MQHVRSCRKGKRKANTTFWDSGHEKNNGIVLMHEANFFPFLWWNNLLTFRGELIFNTKSKAHCIAITYEILICVLIVLQSITAEKKINYIEKDYKTEQESKFIKLEVCIFFF